jgi:streptomycin 6-kinase
MDDRMDSPVFPLRWNVSEPVLLTETFSSRIWTVRLADGTPAIVKDLKPVNDVWDELRGAHYLSWRDGEGAVRLLGRDGQRMLLEHGGDRLLSQDVAEKGDVFATEVVADVMERLLSPSDIPYPADLQPLRERFRSLFRNARIDHDAGKPSLYVEAANIAERLLSNPREVRPLHGDLHHQNVLFGLRGWLAIDPKGVLGDPGFDASNVFYNPLDRDDLCLDPERIARMAAVFARTLKQDPAAILDHAFAYGCLSAAWHAEDGQPVEEQRTLAIARAIREVAVRL